LREILQIISGGRPVAGLRARNPLFSEGLFSSLLMLFRLFPLSGLDMFLKLLPFVHENLVPSKLPHEDALMRSFRTLFSYSIVVLLLINTGSALAQDTLRFAWLTDLHFGKSDYEGEILAPGIWLRQALQGISASAARFIFLGGDIIESSNNAAQYGMFDSAMQTVLPWYPMPGNHDIGTDPTEISTEETDTWISRGYGRGTYGREYYGIAVDSLAAFFVLNTQAPLSNEQAMLARADRQLAEMDSIFTAHARAAQKFVCSHVPLFIQARDEANAYFNVPTGYRNRILALMEKHGVKTYLAGHRHAEGRATNGGITVFTQTALSFQLGRGNQRGYYMFTVTPDTVLRAHFPLLPMGNEGVR
jgi:predicted MPP superfamily phosphohydrolase